MDDKEQDEELWYNPKDYTIEEVLLSLQRTEIELIRVSAVNSLLECNIKHLTNLLPDDLFETLIKDNKKISAIRTYRIMYDCSLKEAKEKIEEMIKIYKETSSLKED